MRDQDYLEDILIAGNRAIDFLGGASLVAFTEDSKTQAACIRQLEIIGEAVKHLTSETKSKFASVPWREWAGMRDILIHAYNKVDAEEVWNTLTIDLPFLLQQINDNTKD